VFRFHTIEIACVSERIRGPVAYGECLNRQIASLQKKSKTPFVQIQLPLSETNGTAAVEFYSKCQLVAHRVIPLRSGLWLLSAHRGHGSGQPLHVAPPGTKRVHARLAPCAASNDTGSAVGVFVGAMPADADKEPDHRNSPGWTDAEFRPLLTHAFAHGNRVSADIRIGSTADLRQRTFEVRFSPIQ
jgi:hypothetical protein